MLKFSLFRIPIGVEWWFWIVTALLGDAASAHDPQDWALVLVWVAVVFISITVHELGHALVGQKYGASPYIRLHGFGGVTVLPGGHFTRKQHILVSAAGPAAGLALGVRSLDPILPPLGAAFIRDALYVNFVWTFINLIPIQPMDGGQILGQILGPQRERLTAGIGFALAAVLCLWCLSREMLFSAVMLGMLAYYNIRRERVEGGVITP